MHRQPLLAQLAAYGAAHPDEAKTIEAFTAFVVAEPQCFERELEKGHITGSAWIIDGSGERVLLTHHRKLDCWLQLGGHADGDPDVPAVALKEAREESGIQDFRVWDREIFDLDIHPIPARGDTPAHLHYDVRYILQATGQTSYVVSEESHDLRWVALDEVHELTQDPSMLRMVGKWKAMRGG